MSSGSQRDSASPLIFDSGQHMLESDHVLAMRTALGLEEREALHLLRAAGMSVDRAANAWLAAGERLGRVGPEADSEVRAEQLALAVKYARARASVSSNTGDVADVP